MAKKIVKAEWGYDFDYMNSRTIKRPMCPVGEQPVYYDKETRKFMCYCCDEERIVDDEMKKNLGVREEVA